MKGLPKGDNGMKKGLILILALVMAMSCMSIVYGAQDSMVKAGNIMVTRATKSSSMIQQSSSFIQNLGNGDVEIEAYTESYGNVDTIKVYVRLQKLTNMGWDDVKSWTKTESNDDYVEKFTVYNVDTGYRYRVRTIHYVTDNGVTESTSTTTNDILIY